MSPTESAVAAARELLPAWVVWGHEITLGVFALSSIACTALAVRWTERTRRASGARSALRMGAIAAPLAMMIWSQCIDWPLAPIPRWVAGAAYSLVFLAVVLTQRSRIVRRLGFPPQSDSESPGRVAAQGIAPEQAQPLPHSRRHLAAAIVLVLAPLVIAVVGRMATLAAYVDRSPRDALAQHVGLALQDNAAWRLQNLGMIRREAYDPSLAVTLLSAAAALDREAWQLSANLAQALVEAGQCDRADEVLRDARDRASRQSTDASVNQWLDAIEQSIHACRAGDLQPEQLQPWQPGQPPGGPPGAPPDRRRRWRGRFRPPPPMAARPPDRHFATHADAIDC